MVEQADWVPLGDLVSGQHVWAHQGPLAITSITPLRQTADAYNLETHGHHVYRVAPSAVLVHNAYTSQNGFGALRDRVRTLGTDPARGFIRAEGIGGVRIEQALGRTIRRSSDEAADFVDDVLGLISLKGPIPSRASARGLANAAIKDAKFNTATNALFIDLRGLSSADKALVRQLVNEGTEGLKKIIRFLD